MTVKDGKKIESSDCGEQSVYSIRLLSIFMKLQQLHGLRHGDYQRYRSYCTRRLQRLRKSLHVPQGDKRHFRKKPITEAHLDNERAIHIPLMQAERAWSYAMQLRLESNTEPRKKFHVISRLRKSVVHAIDLQKLCKNDRFDALTKLEADAYVAWMKGTLYFELKIWTEAIENLKTAQLIYEKLAASCGEMNDDVIYYNQKIRDLNPSIRYCAYHIGDDTAIEELLQLRTQANFDLLKNIDMLMTQANETNNFTFSETVWLGKPLNVKSEKVRMFLLSNRDLDKTLDQNALPARIEFLEQHLMDCKDAISDVQDNINSEQAQKNVRPAIVTQLQHLLSYLTYIRLERTIQRNLFLADTATKNLSNPFGVRNERNNSKNDGEEQKSSPRYVSRLYELSLQHILEMEQIPGLNEDEQLTNQLNVQKFLFSSYRCYYIAMELVTLQNWNMAIAAYDEALNNAKKAADLNPAIQPKLNARIGRLIEQINVSKYTTLANSVIQSDTNASDTEKEKQLLKTPLYDRLNSFGGGDMFVNEQPDIASQSPNLRPVPFKPLFFDLVHDKIRFPPLKESTAEEKKSTGLTQFVKGIWGWGGSKN